MFAVFQFLIVLLAHKLLMNVLFVQLHMLFQPLKPAANVKLQYLAALLANKMNFLVMGGVNQATS